MWGRHSCLQPAFKPALGCWIILSLLSLLSASLRADVKRVVIIKVDGVPQSILERELERTDPTTGKSTLPWMDRVFAHNGTRLDDFYVRSISLSTPSWSMLDTGRHLEIRGNAEFDRYTGHVYDYLNFFPFYVGYARSRKVDMPGVEVLDDLGIPLLIDRFPYSATYQGFQLFQRGVRWKTLQNSLQHRFSRSLRELLDEWTIGFEIGSSIEEQTERELIAKLADPKIQYLDYFSGDYDHVAHATPDAASQRLALQRIDALIGRVWTAIESSPLANQTVLVLISDHGMNTQPGVYSQGYDLVQFFNSRVGGGHHVVTNRHPLTEFKLKGLDPFVSEVVTPSQESRYLKGAAGQYPTVLLDLDGNERASVYIRNSDWNVLQILLEELDHSGIAPAVRRAAVAAFFDVLGKHRAEWQSMLGELHEELAALHRAILTQHAEAQPRKWTAEQRDEGLDKAARRLAVRAEAWSALERSYSQYAESLSKLLALSPAEFEKRVPAAENLIPHRAMGEPNTVQDLENYVVGPRPGGLVLAADGSLDMQQSFERIDYLQLLASLSVRNNVQPEVGSRPVDLIALRDGEDAIRLYSNDARQSIIRSRRDPMGNLELRYEPVGGFNSGFPLRLWEDPNLAVEGDRADWLSAWHPESEWLRAVHKTRYSNGIIALEEQFQHTASPEATPLERFNTRRRRLAEPDFLIFTNDHWNFNVRGFNPGGNHGSLLRISTRSVLMLAGGAETGVPRNLVIEDPYDSLSFVPTILDLMGLPQDAAHLPGKPIRELLPRLTSPESTARTQ